MFDSEIPRTRGDAFPDKPSVERWAALRKHARWLRLWREENRICRQEHQLKFGDDGLPTMEPGKRSSAESPLKLREPAKTVLTFCDVHPAAPGGSWTVILDHPDWRRQFVVTGGDVVWVAVDEDP